MIVAITAPCMTCKRRIGPTLGRGPATTVGYRPVTTSLIRSFAACTDVRRDGSSRT